MSDSSLQQRIVTLEAVPFPQLNTTRRVRVLLPESYQESDQRYPVLYFHDGQNAFYDQDTKYGTAWKVQTRVDRSFLPEHGRECIVVAIDNSPKYDYNGRFDEYSPWKMDSNFALPGREPEIYQLGGQGAEYAEFVAVNLKQRIDSEFRTLSDRDSTLVAGSSMGGLISLYIAVKYNHVFGASGVFSPAFWFNKAKFFELVDACEFAEPHKLYMDMGTNETSDETRDDFPQIYLDDAKQMFELLSSKNNVNVRFEVGEGDIHNEKDWHRRFPMFMEHCLF